MTLFFKKEFKENKDIAAEKGQAAKMAEHTFPH